MPDLNSEKLVTPEAIDPKSITIVTATYYPSWYPGEVKGSLTSDKLRGDLAIESARVANEQGFQLVVVDGSTNQQFKEELEKFGVHYLSEQGPSTQGAARRQGLEHIQNLDGVKVICETEPEKVSIIRDCLVELAQPVARGEADIVIPQRTKESFSTLPTYQAKSEQRFNKGFNQLMRSRDWLKDGESDIDLIVGVRVFANKPEIIKLFEKHFSFNASELALHKIVKPDVYSNPLYFPIVEALHDGLRVRSVEVPYVHPKIQSDFEEGQADFDRKRDIQRRAILTELLHFIRYLEESPKSRISSTI